MIRCPQQPDEQVKVVSTCTQPAMTASMISPKNNVGKLNRRNERNAFIDPSFTYEELLEPWFTSAARQDRLRRSLMLLP